MVQWPQELLECSIAPLHRKDHRSFENEIRGRDGINWKLIFPYLPTVFPTKKQHDVIPRDMNQFNPKVKSHMCYLGHTKWVIIEYCLYLRKRIKVMQYDIWRVICSNSGDIYEIHDHLKTCEFLKIGTTISVRLYLSFEIDSESPSENWLQYSDSPSNGGAPSTKVMTSQTNSNWNKPGRNENIS